MKVRSVVELVCWCFAIFMLFSRVQAEPWGNIPDWVSGDNRFTMSVALADLDNDGDLDLIAGNYNYPYDWTNNPSELQVSSIGSYLVVYEYDNGLATTPIIVTDSLRCIDCIDVGDYNSDGYLDIALGTVVGKGGDGGVIIFRNRATGDISTSIQDTASWRLGDESCDAHCVRWVDYDCDGNLDLAALEVPGLLHIYLNESGSDFADSTTFDFLSAFPPPWTGESSGGGGTDDLNSEPIDYPISGTTMEYGDMDLDGDFDLYINIPPIPMVFKHLYGEQGTTESNYYDLYSSTNRWIANTTFKENQFCASFGFFNSVNTRLALAIGSFEFVSYRNREGWRNDVYTLSSNELDHSWQSMEWFDTDNYSQLVTDIQWAKIGGTVDTMDLVTVSYPLCNGISDYKIDWDNERGRECYYEDPGTETQQEWDWACGSSTPDLSTSLALGDMDNPDSLSAADSVQCWKNGVPIGIAYIKNFPAYQIDSVFWRENIQDSWEAIADSNWCANAYNGWVSVSREYIAGLNELTNFELKIKYHYSPSYDLAVGNDGRNVVYLNGGSGVCDSVTYDNSVSSMNFNPRHSYNQNHFVTDNDLMAKDAIGVKLNGYSGYTFNANAIDAYLTNNPEFKRVSLGAHWPGIEILCGHYFWNFVDKNLDAIISDNCEPILFSMQHPIWTEGALDTIQGNNPHQYPSDERLHSMFVRNFVNRYRPGGIYPTEGNTSWGNDGVCIYHFENEPSRLFYNTYSKPPSSQDEAIVNIAEKIFREYQMIKHIAYNAYGSQYVDSLQVISPNWTVHHPEDFESPSMGDDDIYHLPPMPYLHAVNDVDLDLPDIPQLDVTNILWHNIDYLCQQMYCYDSSSPYLQLRSQDPFAPVTVENHDDLRVGIEHLLWGYYTQGLDDYISSIFGSSFPSQGVNWDPLFDTGTDSSLHPFFAYEWSFGLENECPRGDWTTAELAELFSVDVYPEDETNDYRLLKWDVSNQTEFTQNQEFYKTVAGVLNDLSGDGMKFIEKYDTAIQDTISDSVVVHITFYSERNYNQLYPAGKVCFIRTDNSPEDEEDEYVKTDWTFEFHNYTTAPPPPPWTPMYDQPGRIECNSSSGNYFQKNADWFYIAPGGGFGIQVKVDFADGEMGPNMLIMREPSEGGDGYSQSLLLHEGWNLVSWHLDLSGLFGEEIWMQEILPDSTYNDWFFDNDGEVYRWNNSALYYPNNPPSSAQWEWDLNYAYYMLLKTEHNWDDFTNRPLLTLGPVENIEPSNAWSHDENVGSVYANRWFFMGYGAPGYCKLASVYTTSGLSTQYGLPTWFVYEGPFHWLIWQDDAQNNYPLYDLKIVKDDQGRVYIPDPDPSHHVGPPIDQIGMLEPGRGYFLGFDADSGETYDFDGWGDWPQWQNNSITPEPKMTNPVTASGNHFTYNKYTHWSYPVCIDTVDQEECPMEAGDEIGVFDGDRCVGAAFYQDEFPLVVVCWEDDKATPMEVDGYIYSNPMTFIWYDASQNAEIEFVLPPTIQSAGDDPIAPQYAGFGQGLFGRRSFGEMQTSVIQLPQQFKLGQNYPNPFNSETVIPLELPQRSKVKIDLYNVQGRLVTRIYQGTESAGWPKIHFNAKNLASGVYFYRIHADGLERGGKFTKTGKLVILK